MPTSALALLLLLTPFSGDLLGLEGPKRAPGTGAPTSPRILLASTELQSVKVAPLDTLDQTSVYELTVGLPEGQAFAPGTMVEYEIYAVDGTALGGGLFLVTPKMTDPRSNTLTALTGFGGIKLQPQQVMIFKLLAAGGTAPRPAEPPV